MDVIEATDLHKSYGDVAAVVGVDLKVAPGEVVAVLGPNGAGKTTTIEMLLGVRSPSRGAVSVFGKPPRHVDVRGRVGAMLQDTDAPESLTVTEMVELVGHYYPYALPIADVLRRADLSPHAAKRVTQLSGGQRQRLSFALAIVGDPDLLFLDEPTASLDVQARQAFWQQVEEFAGLGKTILFSTHNLPEADLAADRILVINRGRVVHDSTPTQIKALIPSKTVTMTTDATLDELGRLEGVKSAVPVDHPETRHTGIPVIRTAARAAPGGHRRTCPSSTLRRQPTRRGSDGHRGELRAGIPPPHRRNLRGRAGASTLPRNRSQGVTHMTELTTVASLPRRLSPLTRPATGTARLLITQATMEVRRYRRIPEYFIGVVVLPIILYAMFGLRDAGKLLPLGTDVGAMMFSFGCYGVVSQALFSFGGELATERSTAGYAGCGRRQCRCGSISPARSH